MSLFPTHRTTALPGGYMGKILRVDLTNGTLKDENLPEEPILKKFIGGQALALYILLKELPLNSTPFGPENVVVMMTGQHAGPWRHQWLLGNLSQSRRLRRPHSHRRIAQAGLSLHRRRQGRAARRGEFLGPRHPRHGRPPARGGGTSRSESPLHRSRWRESKPRRDARQRLQSLRRP